MKTPASIAGHPIHPMLVPIAIGGLRWGGARDLQLPMLTSAVAILMLLVSGWLGGKLVFEHGVGVGGRDAR